MAKTLKGRKKLQMMKIKNKTSLQVTFSKRKYGIFKKASELGTLCGVEIGVIMFSPSRKVFSFGNPDIRSVMNGFNNHLRYPHRVTEDGQNATIQDLNNIFTQELAKLEMEKENKKDFDQIKSKREETENWWEKPPNQLDSTQTNCLIKALEDLEKDLRSQPSHNFQTNVPQSHYGGSYNNVVAGCNINTFDQRRMVDVNAMNYNPNMFVRNHGPMFGYNNNNNVFEGFLSL
ncbi:Agamous-like MADS-box protein AGL62 [Cardamine amara subsp. amara]|uniref:Agamous-like MADS-box protein AGL62 n=1 Tax=Cardamine amara subsp. amara TaxID=228776 RepID=A0ABD1ALH4_CARAN